MDQQTYSWETEDDGEDYLEASHGNKPGVHLERMHECSVCRLSFRESQMTEFRGKWYGIPCTCAEDIQTIVRKEREDRLRSRARKEEVGSQPGTTYTY